MTDLYYVTLATATLAAVASIAVDVYLSMRQRRAHRIAPSDVERVKRLLAGHPTFEAFGVLVMMALATVAVANRQAAATEVALPVLLWSIVAGVALKYIDAAWARSVAPSLAIYLALATALVGSIVAGATASAAPSLLEVS